MSTTLSVSAEGVAVIGLQNPPVNSLTQNVLRSVLAAFSKASADAAVKAIVITSASGANFCGGAEIAEFEVTLQSFPEGKANETMTKPMHDLFDLIDASTKPVVAAISGVAFGGGLELAMACHWRVSTSSGSLGLPEINLGLIPGGQGTQRLPRLVPIEAALQMMLSGAPVSAQVAAKQGLVDALVPQGESLLPFACAFALKAKARSVSRMPLRKIDRMKVAGGACDMAAVQASKMRRGNLGVAAVAAAVKACFDASDFAAGCRTERVEFARCVSSKQSAAFRYLFFAERASGKVDGLGEAVKPAAVKQVGVIGSGLMGGGIAMCFLNKNIPVILIDTTDEALTKGVATIKATYDKSRSSKPEVTKRRMDLLTATTAYEKLAECDLVVEAVYENLELKQQIFRKLDAVTKKSCILATNTSSLDIDQIAAVTARPEKVVGMHFFSPANVMKLLENVRTRRASPETLVTVQTVGRLIGKVPVLVGNCDGFVGNRMLGPYAAEARVLLEEGATVEGVDQAVTTFGYPMGPLSLADLVGLDLFYRMRKMAGNMNLETKVSIGPYEIQDWLCERGFTGQRAGRGFFLYQEGKKAGVNGELAAVIKEIAAKKKTKQREFKAEELIQRLLFPLVNEGFKILEENMAQRPSDVDVIYVFGFGFPPSKGGPMWWAENLIGLKALLAGLEDLKRQAAGRLKPYHEPSALLRLCVAENLTVAKGLKKWRTTQPASSKL